MDWTNEDRVRDFLYYCHQNRNNYFRSSYVIKSIRCTEEEYSDWIYGRVNSPQIHSNAVTFCKHYFNVEKTMNLFSARKSANNEEKEEIPAAFLATTPMSIRSQRLTSGVSQNTSSFMYLSKKTLSSLSASGPTSSPSPSTMKTWPSPSRQQEEEEEEKIGATVVEYQKDDETTKSSADDAEQSIAANITISWRGKMHLVGLSAEKFDKKTTQELRLCTWNLKNVGKNCTMERRANLCLTLIQNSITAVQEILCEDLKTMLQDENSAMAKNFEFVQSSVGKNRPKMRSQHRVETLAFVFNRHHVSLVRKQTLDKNKNITYSPLLCEFRAYQKKFFVLNVHVSFFEANAKGLEKRRAEVQEIMKIVLFLKQTKQEEVYVCGDFNLEPSDPIFVPWMTQLNYRECNVSTPTTVGVAENVFDNIWIPNGSTIVDHATTQVSHGIDLRRLSAQRLQQMRHEQSDHLPVTVEMFFQSSVP